ncbi:hypothetical protein H4R20_004557 [Coemansia guatemalensis]|uniref:Metallo-beta-lactamase domain-containing protein n=1 Tax=Coemansia guatemalensis TaxID=2761395 RepID=A0A9W8LRY8_9FUNG|nr:hypothetical protein H4R20_004557 [Coemansia guatemalensis]
MSSRAFGLGLTWLRANRGSVPVCCFGAIAGVTAYVLLNDQWIAYRRQQHIDRRKKEQKTLSPEATDVTSSGQFRFASLNIGGRFVNPFETWRDKTLWDFVKWLVTRTSGNGLPKDPEEIEKALPLARPHFALLNALSRTTDSNIVTTVDDEQLSDNRDYVDYPNVDSLDRSRTITATWLGQSTCFVQIEGLNILTDPIFKRRTVFSWLGPERLRPAPCQLEDLPHPDIVLVSHNHFDHLDSDVVRKLGNTVTWYVPLGLRNWFARHGVYKVKELDWWQEVNHQLDDDRKFRIISTPTQHWSGRNGLDSNSSLWSSFLVKGIHSSVFHCGDTGYCPAFEDVGKRYGPVSLAILPIGSYEPRWYMCHQHVNPDDAVRIHKDLRAANSIGVHWGTFMMSDEHYLAPPRDLAAACSKYNLDDGAFVAPQIGKTRLYFPTID